MQKSLSIFGVLRPSLLGDIIVSLPFLNYLEKKYPDSYKCAFIDKKCQQILPFLFNHPLIDKIQISEKKDEISLNDFNFANKFNIKYHPFPQHPYGESFYNTRDIVHETFLMNYEIGKGYIDPAEWEIMDELDKFPKLNRWFDTDRYKKTIAIWPSSGYKKDNNSSLSLDLRSPNKDWWVKLLNLLPDYKIIQLGFPDSELIDHPNIIDLRKLSLFEAIKISLGCDLTISTDSGCSWILGAYGANQIVLYTNYKEGHVYNLDAYCPKNYKNNLSCLFGNGGINNIKQQDVINSINQF